MDKSFNITLKEVVGLITLLLLFFYLFNTNKKLEELQNIQKAQNDTLTTWIEDGVQKAKTSAAESEDVKDYIKAAPNSPEYVALKKELQIMKKYLKKQGSVTNVSTVTKYDTIYKTTNTDKLIDSIKNSFISAKFGFKQDSTFFSLKVKNEYNVTVGRDPKGLLGLGKSTPFAQVTNLNPYTETKTLKTYQVSLPKPKKISVGPYIGYGFSNSALPSLSAGIGVQYSVISF